jgi:S1-C subfamily serine protease
MEFQRDDVGALIGALLGALLLGSFFFIGQQTEDVVMAPLIEVAENADDLPHPSFPETANVDDATAKEEEVAEPPATPATSTPPRATQKPTQETTSSPVTPTPPKPPQQTPAPSYNLAAVNVATRAAAVNILCLPGEGRTYGTSGSGIIVDPRGIILTNAHVAYNLLLKDLPQKDSLLCTIKTGSPAVSKYKAKLIFLPLSWATANVDALLAAKPSGTGEADYALLAITESIDGSPLPQTFPFVPFPDTYDLAPGNNVVVAGYPAGFLGSETIATALPLTSAYAVVRDIFTFEKTTVDVLSLGGSPVAQQGVSGSAVVDSDGNLAAIAVTSSQETETKERELRAITIGHTKRHFSLETGTSLSSFLSSSPQSLVSSFEATLAPDLLRILEKTVQ